ncbi:MAG TPA: DUF2188 domain-containing protein [Polyangiaceae bacterium]|nr:DUF2188 domain-containing protein [Polyangiaceae bacterium]
MKHPKRTPQHGRVYRVRSVDGGWEVFDRDDHRASERMRAQADAVAHAKELARRDGSAQIIVYDPDGKVVSEFFYQRDERPALAYDDSTRTTAASHAATAGETVRDPRAGR